ncbi:glycoside hydrolase family 15 protein [Gayadomonas joobiniege]|uniref:glycoside hydrolase family 15 protein n=1 Tax=Gayadomonas joobiniege TaxID=1234606 RepID=UPI0003822F75|nr:glycoside hydrolase family 15 protein [Gayadomonas joobiniege]
MKNKQLLETLYEDIHDIILSRQHPVTGLLPASTAITTHGNYTDAWVRDNVYSIMSVWALSLAYRRHGDNQRYDELAQATIKLMRGLLQSMMRQADKVERFKHTQAFQDALHAKYDTASGLTVVGDNEWGHLQIDATSIFLLMLAQMGASGLRIVNTFDEVDFVQNLIYYIAYAYRIPDYGIWERGNKINNGKVEINASSVGMAKAALQALDGFNLFGRDADKRAIVHSIPDGISRARNTLSRLLPRESISKEVDSALLSIIGFPAFAVGDKKLVQKTRNKILSELAGEYGCKRFLWDGHQTVVEDHSRIHYEHKELTNFKDIESEWPLFYTYLYIQAFYDNDLTAARAYRQKLESLMIEKDGKKLLPELYYLQAEHLDAERERPHSQPRTANENLPLVWAQSLYYVGFMLDEGLLEPNDLDKLKLRYRSSRNNNTQIALVVFAENEHIKQLLSHHGIIAETPEEIRPLRLLNANQLVDVYQHLGANQALNLTGRPRRRLQSLATAQSYQINQTTYLCLSASAQTQNNYRHLDAELESEVLKNEIEHISNHWIHKEAAVVSYMVTQSLSEADNIDALLKTLQKLQLRNEMANVGYASASLAHRASRVTHLQLPEYQVRENKYRRANDSQQDVFDFDCEQLKAEFKNVLAEIMVDDDRCYSHLIQWTQQNDTSLIISDEAEIRLIDLIAGLYKNAIINGHWLTARWCFSVLGYSHPDLADDLSLLSSRNLSILVGRDGITVLSGNNNSLQQEELITTLNMATKTPLERTLVQEILLILSYTIRTNTRLFEGLRSIHLHNLLNMCCNENSLYQCNTIEMLAALSPFQVKQAICKILKTQHSAYDIDVSFSFSRDDGATPYLGKTAAAMDTDWLLWRSQRGLITRFDDDFLTAIWQSLAHCKAIVFADVETANLTMDSELIRSSMTPGEESFARLVDDLIQKAHPVYYKAALVETLAIFYRFCQKHPSKTADKIIVLGEVLAQAAQMRVAEKGHNEAANSDLEQLLMLSPTRFAEYINKALEYLIEI